MDSDRGNRGSSLIVAAAAAFCVYFCMYAFRKPFTAATYEGQQWLGFGLKTALVISQLAGYMLSKFIGIKVVSEMPPRYRAAAIVLLIALAELALVGFAFMPVGWKGLMLFFNGLPLGMVFGLVLAYLEGRRHTEALAAALCASFIISSGVVKSVGRAMMQSLNVDEFHMPMLTGLLFFPPLLLSVWLLQRTPPPDDQDRSLRSERNEMTRAQRYQFVRTYWPGLAMVLLVYVLLTVIRTIRDDFAVEIWRDLGIDKTPSIFARSETVVALCVTALNGLAVCILNNWSAIRITLTMMCVSFLSIGVLAFTQSGGWLSPFVFMVACGVGMYLPYVAFHTTVFERLISLSHLPCNIAFLMYLADAIGYLGYAIVLVMRTQNETTGPVLPFFRSAMIVVAAVSIACLLGAIAYFARAFGPNGRAAIQSESS